MRLEGKDLGFCYRGGPWLFRDLDVAIEAGEVVGLMGPSGCGKTTLGRILSGFEKPVEGHVWLNGNPLPRRGYRPVQMVFQHPERAVNPRWRLRRTLAEGWSPHHALLARLGIHEAWLDRFPHELSAGELQRICIARALAPETRFLIADEMTTMLDAVMQAQIFHALLEIVRERRLGMLVISHDPHLIRRVCQRVIEWES